MSEDLIEEAINTILSFIHEKGFRTDVAVPALFVCAAQIATLMTNNDNESLSDKFMQCLENARENPLFEVN